MGMMTDFSCLSCGYHVDAMVSGYDMGMASHVVAISCTDCRELRVARVPGEPREEGARSAAEAATAQGRLPDGVRCPRSSRHRISVWTDPGPCPRCAATLERGSNMILWD